MSTSSTECFYARCRVGLAELCAILLDNWYLAWGCRWNWRQCLRTLARLKAHHDRRRLRQSQALLLSHHTAKGKTLLLLCHFQCHIWHNVRISILVRAVIFHLMLFDLWLSITVLQTKESTQPHVGRVVIARIGEDGREIAVQFVCHIPRPLMYLGFTSHWRGFDSYYNIYNGCFNKIRNPTEAGHRK